MLKQSTDMMMVMIMLKECEDLRQPNECQLGDFKVRTERVSLAYPHFNSRTLSLLAC